MEKLEVSELLPRLSGTEDDQVEALKELHRVAVWSRGSTLPRGDLIKAAGTRLSESDEKRLLSCLKPEKPVEVQRRAALALGHLGGPNSVKPLEKLMDYTHSDSTTRSYGLSALRTIGGPEAAEILIHTLDRTPGHDVEVMDKALTAIVDLMTGGSESDLEDATVVGSSRAREQRLPSRVAQKLKGALDRIIRDESLPRRLRFRAREILTFLTETGVVSGDADAVVVTENQRRGDPAGGSPPPAKVATSIDAPAHRGRRAHSGGAERTFGTASTPWHLRQAAASQEARQTFAIFCEVLDESPWTITVPMFRTPMFRDDARLILHLQLPDELSNKSYSLSLRFSGREYGGAEITSGANKTEQTIELDVSEVPEETKKRWLEGQSWRLDDFQFVLRPVGTEDGSHAKSR